MTSLQSCTDHFSRNQMVYIFWYDDLLGRNFGLNFFDVISGFLRHCCFQCVCAKCSETLCFVPYSFRLAKAKIRCHTVTETMLKWETKKMETNEKMSNNKDAETIWNRFFCIKIVSSTWALKFSDQLTETPFVYKLAHPEEWTPKEIRHRDFKQISWLQTSCDKLLNAKTFLLPFMDPISMMSQMGFKNPRRHWNSLTIANRVSHNRNPMCIQRGSPISTLRRFHLFISLRFIINLTLSPKNE